MSMVVNVFCNRKGFSEHAKYMPNIYLYCKKVSKLNGEDSWLKRWPRRFVMSTIDSAFYFLSYSIIFCG